MKIKITKILKKKNGLLPKGWVFPRIEIRVMGCIIKVQVFFLIHFQLKQKKGQNPLKCSSVTSLVSRLFPDFDHLLPSPSSSCACQPTVHDDRNLKSPKVNPKTLISLISAFIFFSLFFLCLAVVSDILIIIWFFILHN